ncbi:Mitochondrial carrier protein ymc2 [Mitosporidium daphniae]
MAIASTPSTSVIAAEQRQSSVPETPRTSGIVMEAPSIAERALRFSKDFAAGWIGGIAQVLVGQPFDTVKVLLQSSSRSSAASGGTMRFTLDTIKKEGFAGLYRGTTVPLFGIGLCVSVQFAALEQMKRFFSANRILGANSDSGKTAQLSLGQMAVSGCVAGIANTVFSGPVEHIRIRLQARTENFTGATDCIRRIYGGGGLRAIYQGQIMTMLRDGVGFGAYFFSYEALVARHQNATKVARSKIETWRLMAYGAIAGVSFWSVAFPFDVIKTKIQVDSYKLGEKRKFPTALACARHIFSTDGVSGFFRGFVPCFLRSAPVNAATFVAFEYAMRVLN